MMSVHSSKTQSKTVTKPYENLVVCQLDVVVHNFNPSTPEVVAERSQVGCQPGIHSEILSQAKTTNSDFK